MKKLAVSAIFCFAFIFGSFLPKDVYATHASGLQIFYRHVANTNYEFTVIFYRNCQQGTAGPPAQVQLGIKSASLNVDLNDDGAADPRRILPRLPISGPGVPPLQPTNLYNCTTAPLCYEEYVYRGTIDLNNFSPGNTKARDWVFYVDICCRPNRVDTRADNLANNGQQYMECGLNNKDFPDGNNSALWHNLRPNVPGFLNDVLNNPLMRTMCVGNFYTFDQSTKDYDDDSIAYEMITPMDVDGTLMNYRPGTAYSLAYPFPTKDPLVIDLNGILAVEPIAGPPGDNIYVISIKATEYRPDTIFTPNGFVVSMREVGYVMRDLTLYVDDASTCRVDNVHPDPKILACGDSIIMVDFMDSNGDPSRVRCESISADGTEFRVIDNSISPSRSIAVLNADWVCGSGNNTDRIAIALAERLNFNHDYTLVLKTGTDLDVLESECGFLEPEFSSAKIKIEGGIPVDLNLPPAISICLPRQNPFPEFTATSPEATSFAWTFNGDTVKDHFTNTLWAQEAGQYKVLVQGPNGCHGIDSVDVYFPTIPEIKFELPPYCDTTVFPDPDNLPLVLHAPSEPAGGTWHWEFDFGNPGGFGLISNDSSLIPVGAGTYKLVYESEAPAPGVPGCISEVQFELDRNNHPPEAPLLVDILGNPLLCDVDDDEATLYVEEDNIKSNFRARPGNGPNTPYLFQWFQGSLDSAIPGATQPSIIRSDEDVYYLLVKDQYGCVGLDSVEVKRIGKQPAFEVYCDVLSGKAGRFTWGSVPFAASYEVSTDGGVNWIPVQDTYFEVEDLRFVSSIKVKAIMPNACKESDVSDSYPCATEVFPPNVFSPNGDGLNDLFFIGSLDLFPGSSLKVLDRWGNVVYESEDYHNDWDGGDASEGSYFYLITLNDAEQSVYKGVITLVR